MTTNIKILVACHKSYPTPPNDIYLPIHVGKALSHMEFGFQGDNMGDNISVKNTSYCELTAVYWAWKNLQDADIVGLCHYRRYFDFHKQCIRFMPDTTFPLSSFNDLDFSIDQKTIDSILKGNVVVPKWLPCNTTLRYQYCEGHISEDFRILEKTIIATQPKEYVEAFNELVSEGFRLLPYNMMIMRRQDFDAYCAWLFDILFRVEKEVSIGNYSNYQQRIFGFMSERLLGVWLNANHKRVLERPIIILDERCSREYPHKYAPRKTVKHYLRQLRCAWINRLYRSDIKHNVY